VSHASLAVAGENGPKVEDEGRHQDGDRYPRLSAALERLRGNTTALLLYGLLALLSFPTLGTLLAGQRGLSFAVDVLEGPRALLGAGWLAHGLTLWNPHITGGNALASQSVSASTPDMLLAILVGPFAA
jgi:hypothetical protein